MEIFAKHFWEKEGKLQKIMKTDTWHFSAHTRPPAHTLPRKNALIAEQYSLLNEVLLNLHYVGTCLGYQNLDFFLQQLQF